MRPSISLVCLLLGALLGLSGCSQRSTEVTPATIVMVAEPLQKDVTDYEEFTGKTAAFETVDVKARVFGYLKQINFKDGDFVQKGDLLFVIDPSTYQAEMDQSRAQVRLAEAQVSYADADYKRMVSLRPTGAVSQDDLDKSLQAKDVARAQLGTAQADLVRRQLDLEFCRISAPISGKIGRTAYTVGNLIQGGQTNSTLLTTIVSVDPMFAYFDIDERTMLRIQQMVRAGKFRGVRDQTQDLVVAASTMLGLLENAQSGILASLVTYVDRTTVVLPVQMKLANDTSYPYSARVDFVNNTVSSSTGTITVRAIFDNPVIGVKQDRVFTPGLFVRIRLPIGGAHRALLVTERALGTNQGEKFVYVVNDKNEVVYRPVTLGLLQDGLREITEGIKAGDKIIVNGLLRVRPGVVVDPKMTEMSAQRESATVTERKPSGR